MVGDGFGGRLWYKPTNYTVGSYSGYSICYNDACNSGTNQLYGWGNNEYEQLGYALGVMMGCNTPTPIPNMTDVKYYSTGYNMGAIKNDGTGWVWGTGLFSTPTNVISNAKFVDGSILSISFVKNDGTVWSLGANSDGNFGNGTTSPISSTVPVQMQGITNAVRVANGYITTYVLLNDGKVKAVGSNYLSSSSNCFLGIGSSTITNTLFPLSITSLNKIIDIKAHSFATAVLDSLGDVYIWGRGGYIGDGMNIDRPSPTKLNTLSNIVAISGCADGDHFLALDANKNCYAWGDNFYGQLGFATPNSALTPTLVATNVIDIMAGEFFSYIVKDDGSLWCSGMSNGGSIWLNLSDMPRGQFTQLNPSLVPGACYVGGSSAIGVSSCNNHSGSISVNNFGGQAPYQYNIGNGNQSSSVFTNLSAGVYTVTITDNANCINTVTCAVTTNSNAVNANFNSSITESVIPLGSTIQLNSTSTNANSFQWQFCNQTTSSNSIVSIPLNELGECCTKLVVTNSICKDSITKCVKVEEPFFIDIPNVFTPNKDSKNDVFKINGRNVKEFNCIIYNRWGQKLYEWNDINGYWDGSTKQGLAPDGTYFYIITYLDNESKTQTKNGFLSLFRD